jgi:hypothetical protein
VLGLKRCILLHSIGTCEPTHLCFPMGGPGPVPHRVSKTPQPCLKLLWHKISEHTQQRKLAAHSYNMWTTSSLQWLTTKTVLKGQSSYTVSYGKLVTRYLERRPRSVKTRSNIWGFTSPKANGSLLQKENKLFVQSRPQLQEDRSMSSWVWLGSAGFGKLTSC